IAHGTRHPPSKFVSFSPRNGVDPPSGQLMTSAPLSVEYITIVLSVMPSSSSLSSSCPTCPSCSTMPWLYAIHTRRADLVPRPVRCSDDSQAVDPVCAAESKRGECGRVDLT